MGGTIIVKTAGTLAINNDSAMNVNGGQGGNQSGQGGKGGDSVNGIGGVGGSVAKQGNGGNGGGITITADTQPATIIATANKGLKGAQNGMAGLWRRHGTNGKR